MDTPIFFVSDRFGEVVAVMDNGHAVAEELEKLGKGASVSHVSEPAWPIFVEGDASIDKTMKAFLIWSNVERRQITRTNLPFQ